jgi:hypothetical protein
LRIVDDFPIAANRQRIGEFFPTAHLRAFCIPVRHCIVEIGGGTSDLSSRTVPYPATSCS